MKQISREQFLKQTAMAGAALLLSSLEGFAITLNKKIKVGIIGCGSVSTQYLPHLTKASFVEIVSACDIKLERAQLRAKEYAIPNVYPHINQMLSGAPFDLFVNLTDMQEHGWLNKQALNAGKHVWSEKPMANTYAEGKGLFELAKRKKLKYGVHLQL
jgi:predicted dehydrogenase